MGKRSSIEQAIHNECVCNYLGKKPDYSDWVITVAFYSAMHFLQHKIFPCSVKINGKICKINSFDEYIKNSGNSTRKHNQFANLVENNCPSIASYYSRLMDTSFSARYNNYTYSREVANTAKKDLDKIKKFCL